MIIICDRPRQLSNRLFVFAHILAFAKENNLKIANLSFAEFAQYFENTKNDLLCRFPTEKNIFANTFFRKIIYHSFFFIERIFFRGTLKAKIISSFRIEEEDEFDQELRQQFIHSSKTNFITVFQGWGFRDNDSFVKHAEFIRNFFTPVSIHRNNIEKLIAKAKKDADILVGIHIRQSDYRKHLGGKYFYSIEQHKMKMREVKNIFQNKKIRFLICSDEIQKENDFIEFDFIFGTGHFIEDLYAFAKCDFLAGPPSTFTMWASFYGNVPLCILENIVSPIRMENFKLHE